MLVKMRIKPNNLCIGKVVKLNKQVTANLFQTKPQNSLHEIWIATK